MHGDTYVLGPLQQKSQSLNACTRLNKPSSNMRGRCVRRLLTTGEGQPLQQRNLLPLATPVFLQEPACVFRAAHTALAPQQCVQFA
jgi:hypothetical protein